MMEIITGVERRRRWSLEEKLRIVAETEQPGIGIAEIARRYEISRGLLWNWRSQVRRGVLSRNCRRYSCQYRRSGNLQTAMARGMSSQRRRGERNKCLTARSRSCLLTERRSGSDTMLAW